MRKTTLRLFLVGVTVVYGANSVRAGSMEFTHGELTRLPQVAHASFTEDAPPTYVIYGQSSAVLDGGDQPITYGEADCQAAPVCESGPVCGSDPVCDSGPICGCDDCGCCDCMGNWRDNTIVFIGSDAWKNFGDAALATPGNVSLSNNFGYRTGFNTGLGIGQSPVRFQVGASYGVYDLKGRFDTLPVFGVDSHPNSVEQQIFATAGFYKRGDVCCGDRISWGVVFDYMYDTRWGAFANEVELGQVRGLFGWALNEANEIGVWGAARIQNDTAILLTPAAGPFHIHAVDQVSAFWHHNWAYGGDTTIYGGYADSPASWVIGATGQVPLSPRTAMYGSTAYIVPGSAAGPVGNSEEIWNVSVGLAFFLGGKASADSVTGNRGLPLLNVADNGTFAVQN